VYERGVALFRYPHVKDIWAAYLAQFVARYKGTKLERARDLFRQALDQARGLSRPGPRARRRTASAHVGTAATCRPPGARPRASASPLPLPRCRAGAGLTARRARGCRRRRRRRGRCSCSLRRWRRTTAWRARRWTCTTAPCARCPSPSAWPSTSSTWPRRPSSLASKRRGRGAPAGGAGAALGLLPGRPRRGRAPVGRRGLRRLRPGRHGAGARVRRQEQTRCGARGRCARSTRRRSRLQSRTTCRTWTA